jgi:hypothetical protein
MGCESQVLTRSWREYRQRKEEVGMMVEKGLGREHKELSLTLHTNEVCRYTSAAPTRPANVVFIQDIPTPEYTAYNESFRH